MVHGIVFVAYCLTTVLVAVDQRWSRGRTLLGLAAAVPPFCTVWFDRYAERRGALADPVAARLGRAPARRSTARSRLAAAQPARAARSPAWSRSLALTGVALLAGPPVG